MVRGWYVSNYQLGEFGEVIGAAKLSLSSLKGREEVQTGLKRKKEMHFTFLLKLLLLEMGERGNACFTHTGWFPCVKTYNLIIL